ncbi:hypothetical protein [Sphingobacterium paucimobilis]|uniref:Uncharacterized protein n=1 Tax=Sphingobacterium paucimobilis HER1398 TaxID=1346330 RepID=U2HZH7_9SPHI|nr:hypothetical protein [Sphingobacterium paucimobilis]ERJ60665.1 hypothetical protein M472_18060 [Sphingobacterium paucimobilis HER1398]
MKTLNPYTVRNEDFTDRIDVVCPRCEKKALVIGAGLYAPMAEHEEKVRFSCVSCGYAIKYGSTPKVTVYVNSRGVPKYTRVLHRNEPIDPFFGFALWYCIEANEGTLWAYNLEHLSVIEAYVTDSLRERNGEPYQNNSIASRLPKWVSAAKNREYVLRLIANAKNR